MDLYLNGTRLALSKTPIIGVGGEAVIYRHNGQALKIFKQPDHPDFEGFPKDQEAARERLKEHQRKLADFPKGLPSRVIAPQDLILNRAGEVAGYVMRLLPHTEALRHFSEKSFRDKGVAAERVRKIFLDIHATVRGIHGVKTVIGDFNDLNVLVDGEDAYFIDADSFQYGPYLTRVFTARFVDPLLCDPQEDTPMLFRPYSELSDWYSYAVLLFQSFLLVDPYGGVYLPNNKANKVAHDARPMKRISVFNPQVRYPKPAIPYSVLPDELLDYFQEVLKDDRREEFPLSLVENLRWTTCSVCGKEHARAVCPSCGKTSLLPIKIAVRVRGKVTCATIFKTQGRIVNAAINDDRLSFVYFENNEYKREDKSVLFSGSLDPGLVFKIQGRETLVGKGGQVVSLSLGRAPSKISVETCRHESIFDATGKNYFWVDQGRLYRNGNLGPEYWGDVLSEGTNIFVGDKFGFGFYRAGDLTTGFVFDTELRGLKDSVNITPMRGQLLKARAYFSTKRVWFFTSLERGGKTINRVEVITKEGMVEAAAEALEGDGSWLGNIRGKCALGDFLLSATDDGIVRVEMANGQLFVAKTFPDTEPFVDAETELFASAEGLYAVESQEIKLLKIG